MAWNSPPVSTHVQHLHLTILGGIFDLGSCLAHQSLQNIGSSYPIDHKLTFWPHPHVISGSPTSSNIPNERMSHPKKFVGSFLYLDPGFASCYTTTTTRSLTVDTNAAN
ncbi:hypothetical protein JCM33374_g4891 [Metschnikowia sp. JCM 33374]|nr:hypothetical protein JCM33374_g4891 [Metschnikowia sp. JCM 33374]